jgi:adenylate cyclase
VTEDRTIVFLDLTGFTALTDTHGDHVAAEVIDRFIETVTAALDGRGRLVKTLGDGVLLETTDPATAIAVADAISHGLHVSDRMPEVTGGIATGPVLDRGDDVLGAVVNLAASHRTDSTGGGSGGMAGRATRSQRHPRAPRTRGRVPGRSLPPR